MERNDFPAHYSADLYDRMANRFLEAYDDWLLRRLMQQIPAGEDATLLDVGTGTARLLCRMAESEHFRNLRLTGMDYFDDMVQVASSNVTELGLAHRIAIEYGDVHALPHANGSVRYIISRSTVHHWRDPILALKEIHRVLVLGGSAFIYEINRDANPAAMARFNQLRNQAGVENSRRDEKYSPEQIWNFICSAGLDKLSTLVAPKNGMMSLGMELCIKKEP